jgi:hypothetical protein
VPKEQTGKRDKNSQGRKDRQSSLEDRARDSNGQFCERSSDTRIDSLRRVYGDSFAPGIRGDAHLKTLLDRTGSNSLSDYLKATTRPSIGPKASEEQVSEKSLGIRYASNVQFKEAHQKTSRLHTGLFRRLAE